MIQHYRNEWKQFREYYWKSFVGFFILFITSGILTYYLFLGREDELSFLLDGILTMFEDKGLLRPDIGQLELAFLLLKNNATASFVIYATGLLPIFLPAIMIIAANGALAGVVFSVLKTSGEGIFLPFLTGIVPHGIFEIPAILLSASLAFYVSLGMIKKINDSDFSLRNCLVNSLKTFGLVVLPLLVIAAFVEAFITPVLVGISGAF